MTMTQAGNVGIGTTSPAYNLDVSGTGRFTTSLTAPSHLLTGSTSGTLTMAVPATVTSYSLKWPSAVASSAGQALTSDGSGNLSWTTLSSGSVTSVGASAPLASSGGTTPTISLTGTIPVANGGTGSASALTPGGILYGSSATASGTSAAGTTGQLLTSNGASAPYWSSSLTLNAAASPSYYITSGSGGYTNMIVPNSMTNHFNLTWPGALASSSGQVLSSDTSGNLSWTTPTSSVTSVSASAPLASSGGLTPTLSLTGTIPVANGGTGSTTALTPGGILYGSSATASGTTSAGAAGGLLVSNGASAPSWTGTGAPGYTLIYNAPNAPFWSYLSVAGGGTGAVSFTQNGILLGGGTGPITATATGTSGQVLTSNGASAPSWTTTLNVTSGNVGIGTTSPSYTLQVNGSVAGTSAYNNTSDIRLKKDIAHIPDALNKIKDLRGVTFNWRKNEHPEMNLSDRQELGVIAQEVEKIFPQAVSENKNTGFKSVAYSMLIAPIIEAMKEVRTWLIMHDQSIASVKAENATLKQENAQIKAYLCAKDPQAPFCK